LTSVAIPDGVLVEVGAPPLRSLEHVDLQPIHLSIRHQLTINAAQDKVIIMDYFTAKKLFFFYIKNQFLPFLEINIVL
jgi:hypothetical protein